MAVEVTKITLPNKYDRQIPGVKVTCDRCGASAECYGQGLKSVKAACVKLNEDCPHNEDNWYEAKDYEEDDP